MLEISLVGGAAFGVLAATLLLLAWLRRIRARVAAQRSALRAGAPAEAGGPALEAPLGTSAARRLELRLETLEARLAEGAAGGGPEERLRDMAGSLIGLIRDKNATLETALAGLDQLRARLRALERVGEVAEARALFEELGGRLDALQAVQAAQAADLGERLEALRGRAEAGEVARGAIAERIETLHDREAAGLATLIARFGPIEIRLAALETARDTEETIEGLAHAELARIEARAEARLAALETARAAGEIALATLRAELEAELGAELGAAREEMAARTLAPVREIAERLAGLHAGRDALAETLAARLDGLEARMAGVDPAAALDRFAERLEVARAAHAAAQDAVETRLGALEHPAENPFAEISERLADLQARRDAGLEAVLARLAPLATRLDELATELGLRIAGTETGLGLRIETVETRIAAEAARSETEAREAFGRLDARLGALESPAVDPFAAITARLAELAAEKEATVEAVVALIAPLESRLADLGAGIETGLAARAPRVALDRLSEAFGALEARFEARLGSAAEDRVEARAALDRLAERIERLRAAQDAAETRLGAVAAAQARTEEGLEPFGTRLDGIEADLAGFDSRAALDRLAARIAAMEAVAATGRDVSPEEEARAEARAVALALIEERTALFANRLALLEASLPSPVGPHVAARGPAEDGLPRAAGATDETDNENTDETDNESDGEIDGEAAGTPDRETARDADLEAIRSMRRIVSLHRK